MPTKMNKIAGLLVGSIVFPLKSLLINLALAGLALVGGTLILAVLPVLPFALFGAAFLLAWLAVITDIDELSLYAVYAFLGSVAITIIMAAAALAVAAITVAAFSTLLICAVVDLGISFVNGFKAGFEFGLISSTFMKKVILDIVCFSSYLKFVDYVADNKEEHQNVVAVDSTEKINQLLESSSEEKDVHHNPSVDTDIKRDRDDTDKIEIENRSDLQVDNIHVDDSISSNEEQYDSDYDEEDRRTCVIS